jgi:hypothetical protein
MSDTQAQQGLSYSPKSSPFLNEVRKVMRLKHMSQRTEASYLHYIIDFIRFCGKQPCSQHILSSGSSTSMSIILVPPNPVCITTMRTSYSRKGLASDPDIPLASRSKSLAFIGCHLLDTSPAELKLSLCVIRSDSTAAKP